MALMNKGLYSDAVVGTAEERREKNNIRSSPITTLPVFATQAANLVEVASAQRGSTEELIARWSSKNEFSSGEQSRITGRPPGSGAQTFDDGRGVGCWKADYELDSDAKTQRTFPSE